MWPLVLYAALVVFIVGAMLGISYVLGETYRRRVAFGRATDEPFESGVRPTGSARTRYAAQFYLVALFFVIFDLEAAFLFGWAIAAREVGWPGYVSMLVFVVLLAAALVYLWRVGALDFGPRARLARKVEDRGAL